MQRDIDLWKKVERPKPTLYKRMQHKVTNEEIKGDLELELARRISKFHCANSAYCSLRLSDAANGESGSGSGARSGRGSQALQSKIYTDNW